MGLFRGRLCSVDRVFKERMIEDWTFICSRLLHSQFDMCLIVSAAKRQREIASGPKSPVSASIPYASGGKITVILGFKFAKS